MTDAELALFHDSLTRCTSHPQFLERFYALFVASSSEVRHKFSRTDFQKQRRLCSIASCTPSAKATRSGHPRRSACGGV